MSVYSNAGYLADRSFSDWEDPWLSDPSKARSSSTASARHSSDSDDDALLSDSERSSERDGCTTPEPLDHEIGLRVPFADGWPYVNDGPQEDSYGFYDRRGHIASSSKNSSSWLSPKSATEHSPEHISPRLLAHCSSDEEISPPSSSEQRGFRNLRPRHNKTPYDVEETDEESEPDSGSEYNPSDSDMISPTRTRPSKHQKLRRRLDKKRSRSPSISSISSTSRSARHHPYARPDPDGHSLARSKQVEVESIPQPTDFHCPFCDHYQANHRRPDLRRHIMVHLQKQTGPAWICCGIPVKLARRYNVWDVSNVRTFECTGQLSMVGGCGIKFSRKDAYRRHLRNSSECGRTCVGDPNGNWIPGNKRQK